MIGITLTSRTRQTVRTLLLPASLLALGTVPVVAGLVRLAGLMTGHTPAGGARLSQSPLPVTLHVLAVAPYALLGALPCAPALRRAAWHRAAGMALVPLGLLAALTGLWMAHAYPWPAGDGEAVYVMRLIVGTAMTTSIVRGVLSLLRHEYAAHGAWMLRGYALGMGAGTQVLTHLPWLLFVRETPDEARRGVMMALAWIINATLAEYVIRRQFVTDTNRTSRRARPSLLSTT